MTYVASVVEVAIGADRRISVPRVWMAVDCGFAQVTFKNGRAEQSNFSDYRILPIGLAPREIDVQIVPNEAPPAGVGEPGVPPIAPALCNAIFTATGKRLRALPIGEIV